MLTGGDESPVEAVETTAEKIDEKEAKVDKELDEKEISYNDLIKEQE
jgi:hypothetical protein